MVRLEVGYPLTGVATRSNTGLLMLATTNGAIEVLAQAVPRRQPHEALSLKASAAESADLFDSTHTRPPQRGS